MTQVEMLARITEIIKDLPNSEELVWSGLPSIPFNLPLGKPACYYKNYGKVLFCIPKQNKPMLPDTINAILNGDIPFCEGEGIPLVDETKFTVVELPEFLSYLGFTKRRKIAECILREYEMELALNDYEPGDTEGNSWLPGVTGEGKTKILELLLGYAGTCVRGVSVSRVDIAWETYKNECYKAGKGVNWDEKITPDYRLYITSPEGERGSRVSEPELIEEFLNRII